MTITIHIYSIWIDIGSVRISLFLIYLKHAWQLRTTESHGSTKCNTIATPEGNITCHNFYETYWVGVFPVYSVVSCTLVCHHYQSRWPHLHTIYAKPRGDYHIRKCQIKSDCGFLIKLLTFILIFVLYNLKLGLQTCTVIIFKCSGDAYTIPV